jgi:plastocyanin
MPGRLGASAGLALILGIILLVGLPGPQGTPARAARTWTVELYGDDMNTVYQYIPQNITINVGDTINFTDISGQHSATSDPGQAVWWDTGVLNPGQSYLVTFAVPGTYSYWSTFPMDMGMVGTVTVLQPVPEFLGLTLLAAVGAATFVALLLQRRLDR